MFAVLIAVATTALVALVSMLTVAIVQRRRVPRSPSFLRHPPLRHTARGVSAALLVLALSGAALVLSFASARVASEAEGVAPSSPSSIVPPSPLAAPIPSAPLSLEAGELATLPLD